MSADKKKTPEPSKVQGAYGEQLSSLPPSAFCPTWLKRGTLADRALSLYVDGATLDHPYFENRTQSWRLAAVVLTLRTLGWPIEPIDIPSSTDEKPGRVIALYRLSGNYMARALAPNGGLK